MSTASLLGEQPVPMGHGLRVRLGMLTLWIRRTAAEWQLASTLSNEQTQYAAEITPLTPTAVFPASATPARFACRPTDSPTLQFRIALANRHIVTRPEMRFRLLEKEQVEIYIGTPLWLQVLDGDRLLCDLPTKRLKSTWFGPNTRTGRLCYATETSAYVQLSDILERSVGAITKLTVLNRSDQLFIFDRVNIPIPSLTTYIDATGVMWTEDVTVVHTQDEHASVQLSGGPPSVASNARMVTEARRSAPESILLRAVKQLRPER